MSYIGDFKLGDTIDTSFCTVQNTGAPTTLAGSPVISAYVGNSTTEITAGITLTVDFDSRTGYNHVRIVATSGNGYATASNYRLVITTGTVNSVSAVGYVVAEFSIENRVVNYASINLPVGAIPALGIIDNGPVQSATSTTLQLRSAVNLGADNNPVAMTAGIFSGTGYGQARAFTAYTNATDTGTVDAWTTTPAANDAYVVYTTAPGSLTNPAPVKVVASSGSYGVKANTALANFSFFMTDSTTHAPLTGATVTVQRSIDGGAFANATNTPATEIASGAYKITLAAGDLNGSTNVMLKCTATGADQRMIEFILSV